MVTGRAILFSASLLCADDNQKESSDPLHCSVKTSLLSSSSFWWSPPRPDQLLLLCSCWLISGTTKTCEDVILCAALQGKVSKQPRMKMINSGAWRASWQLRGGQFHHCIIANYDLSDEELILLSRWSILSIFSRWFPWNIFIVTSTPCLPDGGG